jgi:hypothetical protein
VRKEWADEHGLAFVNTQEFDRALDAVCSRLSVHRNPNVAFSPPAVAVQRGLEVRSHRSSGSSTCMLQHTRSVTAALPCNGGDKEVES